MELNKKSCPWQPARIRPPLDEPVLIITRQGSIWKRTFRKYLSVEEPMFSPDALKLGKDVLWWMPVPDDNWHDCAVEKPAVETWVLLKDQYGDIRSGKWGYALSFCKDKEFYPFTGHPEQFWRDLPALPEGVELNDGKLRF